MQKAAQLLMESEASLRRLIIEAAEAADYQSAETLIRWAGALAEMASPGSLKSAPTSASSSSPTVGNGRATSPPTTKTVAKRRSYPIFARAGTNLVKIGWSKSSRSEYHHKSPLAVVKKLAEVLGRRTTNSAVVRMDRVLPLRLDDGSDVPDYQTYVSLAWFRQIGAVTQNGRQGYTVRRPSELPGIVQAAWDGLAEVKPL